MNDTIGIDISKDTLDCFQLSGSKHCQYRNNNQGHKALIKWIKSQGATLVVFEATGAYHRCLEAALAKQKHPFVKVNPRQARRFAEATGRLAKTDRVPSRRWMLQCLQKWARFWIYPHKNPNLKTSIFSESC